MWVGVREVQSVGQGWVAGTVVVLGPTTAIPAVILVVHKMGHRRPETQPHAWHGPKRSIGTYLFCTRGLPLILSTLMGPAIFHTEEGSVVQLVVVICRGVRNGDWG